MEEEKVPFREQDETEWCSKRKVLVTLFFAFFLTFPIGLTIMMTIVLAGSGKSDGNSTVIE